MSDDSTFTGGDIQAAETAVSSGSSPTPAPTTDLTVADSSGVAPTTPPASASPVVSPPSPAVGEPPKERWEEILANQRQKAATDRLTELGLNGFTAEQIKAIAPWVQRAQRDPSAFLVDELTSHANPVQVLQAALSKLQAHPAHGQVLKSLIGRAMQQLRQPTQTPDAGQMVRVQLEDGTEVQMPRNPAAWLDAQKQQWFQQMQTHLQPVTQTVETLQQERAAAEHQLQVDHFVTSTHQDVLTWPGMQDAANQKAVAVKLGTMPIDPHDPREVALALNAAYRSEVLPTLHTASRQAVLTDLHRQAAASTVNPARTSTRTPKTLDEMSIQEALEHTAQQLQAR